MTSMELLRSYLPSAWIAALSQVRENLQELRLRADAPIMVSHPQGELVVTQWPLLAPILCCTLGEEDKALSLASRGSQLGWGDRQGSPQPLTSGIGLAEDRTESWREGSRDPWVSREGGSLEAGPPRTPGGPPVISHVSNSQGFTGCVGVGLQDGSGRQGSSGACPGHLRG